MSRETCSTCTAFCAMHPDDPRAGFDSEMGECRARAPEMMGWPIVKASDWCRQHRLPEEPKSDDQKYSNEMLRAWIEHSFGDNPDVDLVQERDRIVGTIWTDEVMSEEHQEAVIGIIHFFFPDRHDVDFQTR